MGAGQLCPGDTANINIGSVRALEEVREARVETLCVGEDVARKAVDALKRWVRNVLALFHQISTRLSSVCLIFVDVPCLTNYVVPIHTRSLHIKRT